MPNEDQGSLTPAAQDAKNVIEAAKVNVKELAAKWPIANPPAAEEEKKAEPVVAAKGPVVEEEKKAEPVVIAEEKKAEPVVTAEEKKDAGPVAVAPTAIPAAPAIPVKSNERKLAEESAVKAHKQLVKDSKPGQKPEEAELDAATPAAETPSPTTETTTEESGTPDEEDPEKESKKSKGGNANEEEEESLGSKIVRGLVTSAKTAGALALAIMVPMPFGLVLAAMMLFATRNIGPKSPEDKAKDGNSPTLDSDGNLIEEPQQENAVMKWLNKALSGDDKEKEADTEITATPRGGASPEREPVAKADDGPEPVTPLADFLRDPEGQEKPIIPPPPLAVPVVRAGNEAPTETDALNPNPAVIELQVDNDELPPPNPFEAAQAQNNGNASQPPSPDFAAAVLETEGTDWPPIGAISNLSADEAKDSNAEVDPKFAAQQAENAAKGGQQI